MFRGENLGILYGDVDFFKFRNREKICDD